MNYSILAKNEIKKNNIKLAILYYKLDLDLNKDCNKFLVYNNIAILYYNSENYNLSLKYIINSIKVNPNWYKSWVKLGYILEKIRKYEDAIKALIRARDLCSENELIESKIKCLNRKLISLQDTDSESSEENIKLIEEKKSNIDMNSFNKIFDSSKIQDKLKDSKLLNKIMDNKSNPFIIFKDKEIFNLMKDMYKEYKKD